GSDSKSATTVTVLDKAPSITVSIDGTAREGATLAAHVTGAELDDTLSYAWTSSANPNTVLGTGATYQVGEDDEGRTITLSVTATAEDRSGSDTKSATTDTVLDKVPSISATFDTTADVTINNETALNAGGYSLGVYGLDSSGGGLLEYASDVNYGGFDIAE